MQLAEHALDVGTHGARADAELARHLLVAAAHADALEDLGLAVAQRAVVGLARGHRALASRSGDHRLTGTRVETPLGGFVEQLAFGITVAEGRPPGSYTAQCLPGERRRQQTVFRLQGIAVQPAEIAAAIESFVGVGGELTGNHQFRDLLAGARRPVRHQSHLFQIAIEQWTGQVPDAIGHRRPTDAMNERRLAQLLDGGIGEPPQLGRVAHQFGRAPGITRQPGNFQVDHIANQRERHLCLERWRA
ncbi:hypothetical protein D3C73_591790 [compost metagenome]